MFLREKTGERGTDMVNMAHVKWYAERLFNLLMQDPDCKTTLNLAHQVDLFLHTTGIDSMEAQAPSGVAEEDTTQDDS